MYDCTYTCTIQLALQGQFCATFVPGILRCLHCDGDARYFWFFFTTIEVTIVRIAAACFTGLGATKSILMPLRFLAIYHQSVGI